MGRLLLGLGIVLAGVLALAPALSAGEGAPSSAGETPAAEAPGATMLQEKPVMPAWDWQRAWSKIKAGGYTMYALGFLSVMGVAFLLERLFNLRSSAIAPEGLMDKVRTLWQQGDLDGIKNAARISSSTLGDVILAALKHRNEGVTDVFARAEDIGGREVRRQLLRAYPLAVVATLSPLLGLMGTIFGMMDSFEIVAVAGSLGDASILADGIAKALVTTATGLIIAVPCLGFYHFFRSRTNKIAIALEEYVSETVDLFTGKETRREDG